MKNENFDKMPYYDLLQIACISGDQFLQAQQRLLHAGYNPNNPKYIALLDKLYSLALDTHGFISQFNTSPSFAQLQSALRDNTATDAFPIGTIFPDTWRDLRDDKSYDTSFRLVDYSIVQTPSGPRQAAILMQTTVTAVAIPLDKDHPQYDVYLATQYLDGCSDNLRAVIGDHFLPDQPNAKPVKFFLPASTELGAPLRHESMLHTWQYFSDTPSDIWQPCTKRRFYSPIDSYFLPVALRSALAEPSYKDYYGTVHTDGKISFFFNIWKADNLAPACAIY